MRAPHTIRRLEARDRAGIQALDRAVVEAGRGVIRQVDELPPDEAAFGQVFRRYLQGMCWVAEVETHLAGAVYITPHRWRMLQHVATIAIDVHPDFQRQGIGKALMQTAIQGAADAQIIRLELQVRADNARAIALYEQVGFAIEATRKRFLRTPEGEIDDHLMVQFLDRRS